MIIIYGINAVKSALEQGEVEKLYVGDSFSNQDLLRLASSRGVIPLRVDRKKLQSMTSGNHQGVVAEVKEYKTYSLSEIITSAEKRDHPIIVMLDELNDPHNLGAILRSSDAFGISGIAFKNRREVSLNGTVAKTSTGAINYVPCAMVVNLSQAIDTLKKSGYRIVGLDGEATIDLATSPNYDKLCLVVGSEGYGISRLVKSKCDLLVKIPMLGHVECLNASVACAIALYRYRFL
jgi:23S rRNA (guanosine2251-2'-O)-methyltransferase